MDFSQSSIRWDAKERTAFETGRLWYKPKIQFEERFISPNILEKPSNTFSKQKKYAFLFWVWVLTG